MADDEETSDTERESGPDTYTPQKTRFETAEVPAPTGGTRTVRFRVLAGQTYTVVPDDEAHDRLGQYAAVNNIANLIRKSAKESASS